MSGAPSPPHGAQVHSNLAFSCFLGVCYAPLNHAGPWFALSKPMAAVPLSVSVSKSRVGGVPLTGHIITALPPPGVNADFSRSGKSAAEFAQEPSQFARMAPGPSRRRGRPAPPTPRIWLTAGALLAVACQGGGERPLETSPGLSLAPWGLAEPAAAAARASEPVIAQPAVGQIRTSGAVPRAPGG